MGGGGIPVVSDVLSAVSGAAPAAAPQPAQQVVDGAAADVAPLEQTADTAADQPTSVSARNTGTARRRASSRRRTLLAGSSSKESILG